MTRRGQVRKFSIGGTLWRWVYRPMRANWGLCDYARRTITIDTGHACPKALLDTELHEALHGLQAFATEEHTAEVASTLAEILYGLGYRRTEPGRARVYSGD